MNKHSRYDFETLFALVAVPIIIVDLTTERVIFVNGRAEEISGYPKDTVNQLTVFKLFSAKSHQQITALLELARRQGSNIEFSENHLGLRRRAGRICPVSLSATQTQWRGRKVLIFTLNDLTGLENQAKERMALLEESARVSKLADIGRLAGGIAHELNNPLAILLGYAENLDYLLSENRYTKEDIRQNLEPMQSAGLRMAKIITKMLAMIRHESTQLVRLSLAQVVRECLIILEDVLKSYSITLECDVSEEFIRGDSTHIEQVITNIVTNACNALQNIKENRKIVIKSKLTDNKIILEIWNNGSPMPEDVQKKVFTPFFTTKDVGEGIGLGLYLCYNIMRAHSGELTFASAESVGTSFFLTFPKPPVEEVVPSVNLLRALVVDDDTFFRKMLTQKLRSLRVETAEARNGQEALQIIQENPTGKVQMNFDLIFVDVKMPRMNGFEFVNLLKKQHPGAHIVMITGYPKDQALMTELQSADVSQLLSKPIQNSELVDIIHTVRVKTHKPAA
ncbi:MAG: response regulator [Bdellovibrionaceae bacterium]|nr:response regulator [Pseudobdellovibrionaceae bacterium]